MLNKYCDNLLITFVEEKHIACGNHKKEIFLITSF